MGTLNRTEAAAFLKQQDNFAILTHRRPDGDTLGCAALLCRGLRQLGKTAFVLENPEITPKYADLLEGLTKKQAQEGDTVVCVDVAAKSMLPQGFADLADKIALRIDHHENDRSFTEKELVESKTAACGEVVYGVLQEMGVSLDGEMAKALYTAVSTDTGCFRYGNTTPDTFRVAADCAAVYKDLKKLNQILFETTSLPRLRIQGWMVENAKFMAGGKICICAIPLEVEQQLGVTEDDMENISGFPRTISGVVVAATLRQEPDRVKISVRTDSTVDASAICAKFGGGGHRGAAGANLEMPMEQATAAVIAAMPEL